MTAIRLNRSNLDRLLTLATPSYDLSGLGTSIVHLGLGGFHRAHMARYTHDLMTKDPQALPWGIVGAGLLESDSAILSDLSKQDRLYTLTERSGGAETISVVGALAGLIDASQRTAALLDAIDRARIVSLTVTEHGYCLDRATKQLSFALPIIEQDLATPEAPRSVPGIIVEAYRRRMAAGAPAFTALSCDNIQHNGDLLRGAVLALAARRDPLLAAWIEAHGRFPNTMVDRITPLTQHHDVAAVAAMGVADMRPVVAETFRQWVIEDDFADGRPAWESVGAQFVADVAPYELMKLRLLNATHLAIAAPARLIGHAYIDDAMRDPALRRYAEALMERETGPTLPAVPGIDLAQYKATIVARFANAAIRDTVERVNNDAALNYLLDPIRDRLAAGQGIDLLAFAVACWLRRVRGTDEQGAAIEVRHPLAVSLRDKAIEGGPNPRPLLGVNTLFGALGEDPAFVEPVARHLAAIYAGGTAAALAGLDLSGKPNEPPRT